MTCMTPSSTCASCCPSCWACCTAHLAHKASWSSSRACVAAWARCSHAACWHGACVALRSHHACVLYIGTSLMHAEPCRQNVAEDHGTHAGLALLCLPGPARRFIGLNIFIGNAWLKWQKCVCRSRAYLVTLAAIDCCSLGWLARLRSYACSARVLCSAVPHSCVSRLVTCQHLGHAHVNVPMSGVQPGPACAPTLGAALTRQSMRTPTRSASRR